MADLLELVPEFVPELVPGYGWVVWPSCRLDESAHRFVQLHQPEPDTSWDGGRCCLYCGRRWPCAELRWAAGRLNLPARTRPVGPSRPRGRHRLDPRRPFPLRRVVVAVLLLLCLVILVVPLSCAPAGLAS